MTISRSQYEELDKMTEYERWSLTRLAELSGDIDLEKYTTQTLAEKGHNREISPDGQVTVLGRIGTGNKPDQVIDDITPLIFASSYKCLDLFIEWLLEINGENPKGTNDEWSFKNKTNKIASFDLEDNPNIPGIFDSKPELFEGITGIYIELVDYRHSIIHDNDFEVNDSKLIVSDDSGNSYVFGRKELFSFAGIVSVCIDAIIEDVYDYVTERQLATMLDNLSHVHDVPSLGLTDYESSIVRAPREPIKADPYSWELSSEHIKEIRPSNEDDVDFWLNLVGLHNQDTVNEWMIPGDVAVEFLEDSLRVSSGEFQKYRV